MTAYPTPSLKFPIDGVNITYIKPDKGIDEINAMIHSDKEKVRKYLASQL